MKILLIDDSGLSRAMFRQMLGGDYTYLEATDGIQGLEKYFLEKPDLVVLDLTMPGLGGMEVLEQLIQMDPNARVVIGTADIQDLTTKAALERGAAGFIHKPFYEANVRAVVKQVLEGQE